MSAEIKDPSRRVPWAMVLAVVLNVRALSITIL